MKDLVPVAVPWIKTIYQPLTIGNLKTESPVQDWAFSLFHMLPGIIR